MINKLVQRILIISVLISTLIPAALSATSIGFGETYSGSIEAAAQMNAYTFSANANDSVIVRIGKTSGNMWPMIRLNGPDGAKLTENYGPTAVEISHKLPSGGTYTIFAFDYRGVDTGNYSIYFANAASKTYSNPTIDPKPVNFSIIDIKKSSETAPEINIGAITKQNLTNETTLLSGSAWSESGIKSVIVNGQYAGNEHWSVNVPGNNNIVIIAVGNDGNVTTENISLTTNNNPKTDIFDPNIILGLVGITLTLVGLLFGDKLIYRIKQLIYRIKHRKG